MGPGRSPGTGAQGRSGARRRRHRAEQPREVRRARPVRRGEAAVTAEKVTEQVTRTIPGPRAGRRRAAAGVQTSVEAGVEACLDAAVEHLRSLQHEDGWWKGDLATNVTMDAEDLMLRRFLGIATVQSNEETARWIRSQQGEDGSWSTFPGGPGELSTTVEAWVALRMAGDDPAAPHMRSAAAFVRGEGGLEKARVFTHMWLALFGLWEWDDCPDLPPELIFLP